MRAEARAVSDNQRQLSVVVGEQSHVIAGNAVLEIIRRPRVTRVPHGPAALLGVCNLRGAVLPVVSLARLMHQPPGPESRVVVLDHGGLLGLAVDAVLMLDAGADSDIVQLDLAALLEAGFKRAATPASGALSHTAAGPAKAEAVPDERALISFRVAGQTFALPLAAVIEVLRLPDEIAHMGQGDSAVLGVTEIRDHSTPIVSLAAILGFTNEPRASASQRVLVAEHLGARIGLVADAIEALLRLPEAAIDKVPAILQRGRGEAELDAIGRPGEGRPLISILSVPRLFANVSVAPSVATSKETGARAVELATTGPQEQFVIFDLGGERYGLPIAAVDEVLRLPGQVTRLPNGPSFVSGIINLRGRPVPIIDQRQRFDSPSATGDIQARVIIVSFGALQAGFVVDAASEILAVDSADLVPTPPLSSERAAVFNRVAHTDADGGLILLIDPQELLSEAERDVIADIAARQTATGLS